MMNIKISKKVSVKQHDQNDCGAACMASVLAHPIYLGESFLIL